MKINSVIISCRHPKTKRFLRQALIELLEEKSFAEIRIAEIAAQSEYTRQAFYSHYSSKEALLEEIVADLADGLIRLVKQSGAGGIEQVVDWLTEPYHPYFVKYFAYMRHNSEAFLVLLRPDNGTNFFRRFSAIWEDYQSSSLPRWKSVSTYPENNTFDIWYHTAMSDLLSGLFQWVLHGMPADEISMAKHHTRMWLSTGLQMKDSFPNSKYYQLIQDQLRKKITALLIDTGARQRPPLPYRGARAAL